jgi:hypothetical protein
MEIMQEWEETEEDLKKLKSASWLFVIKEL